MNVAGLTPGAVLRLVREARGADHVAGPLLVAGPLSAQLARQLADGGDEGLVRTTGAVASASAFVCVLAGPPTTEQLSQLRAAARAGVPAIAVQMGDTEVRIPYVLRSDVVVCRPGEGFPVPEVAAAIVAALGREAAPLSARLPVLRGQVQRGLTVRAAGIAAGIAAAPWGTVTHLPLLVLLQARLLRDLAVATGQPAPSTQQEIGAAVGPEIGAALGLGLAARSLVRRLPARTRVVDAAVAAAGTVALAAGATRLRS